MSISCDMTIFAICLYRRHLCFTNTSFFRCEQRTSPVFRFGVFDLRINKETSLMFEYVNLLFTTSSVPEFHTEDLCINFYVHVTSFTTFTLLQNAKHQ